MAAIEETINVELVGLRIHVEAHKMSEKNVTIADIVSWVRSTRVFKKIAKKK